MASLTEVFVPVRPDTDQFQPDLERKLRRIDARRAGMSVGQGLGKGMRVSLFQSFGDVGKGITGAFAGLAALRVFGGFINDARESVRVGRLTEQVIRTTGGAAGITAKQVGDLANAISNKTGIDDEAIQSAENLLLTFTNVRNEVGKGNDVFNQASKAAIDMATALGTEPSKAAIQLGKALNSPITGITALSKAGVSFTAQQKAQIKTMVESGNILGAQKIILAELGKEFGGAAEAAADPLQKLRVIAGNLGENIGTLLLPVVEQAAVFFADLAPKVDAVSGFIGGLPAPVKAAALTIGGLALAVKLLGPLATVPGKLAASFDRMVVAGGGIRKTFDESTLASFRLQKASGQLSSALFPAAGAAEKLSGAGSRIGAAFKGALLSISPLTLAIGAAATIVGIYAQKKAAAKQRVDEFTEAIKSDSGALGENTRALVSQRLEQEGSLRAGQQLGLNLQDITDAALGNTDAMTRVNVAVQAVHGRYQQFVGSGQAMEQGLGEQEVAAQALERTLGGTNSAVNEAAGAAQRQAAATGPATAAIKDQGVAANAAKVSIADLTTKLFALVGVNADAATTDIAFRDSLHRLTESVKENGTSISLTTQKGRDNRTAVIASIEAAQRHAEAVGKQTGREIDARRAFEASIPQIREQARRLGLNKDQVDALIRSIAKLKPKTVPVKAVVSVVDAITARADTRGPGDFSHGRAFGGWIPGYSPSDRSDNIPARLTAGEFVVQRPTARKLERRAPGFLEALNTGSVDVGGDTGIMRASIGRPLRFARGGSVPAVQRMIRAQDPDPYIWGAAGPYGFDCSGLVGAAYGALTGKGGFSGQRYFTTDTIGRAQGFRPGLGTFTVGVTPGRGHMAGQLGSLKFEARSTAAGIIVGNAAASPTSFSRKFFLPQLGGTFGADGLTTRQKHQIVGLIRPQVAQAIIRELRVTNADRGAMLPPRSTTMVRNGTDQWEPVGPPGGGGGRSISVVVNSPPDRPTEWQIREQLERLAIMHGL